MARLFDNKKKFLIVEGTGSEFLKAGFGGGDVVDRGIVMGGVFDGFSLMQVLTGQFLCCDNCNQDIGGDDVCYYIAVLNMIFDKGCFELWLKRAKRYPSDAPYEKEHYERVRQKLADAGIAIG